MRTIKCKYCRKSYSSPSEMQKRKCHSHPNGAWGGYCTPDRSEKLLWELEKHHEDQVKAEEVSRNMAEESDRFVREYKKHTPLLDCVLKKDLVDDEPCESSLEIRNSDLNQLALNLANGINSETRDAINTIYALRAGCDYVLHNSDAQKEGSLNTWLDSIKQLKDEVVSWDFWVALFWLTKPLNSKAVAAKKEYSTNRKAWDYWTSRSLAHVFHTKQVLPMLRAVNKKGDERDKEVMNTIDTWVTKLKLEKTNEKGFDPGQIRCIEMLCRRIGDYSFWGVIYCLYWMKLRPTPWDDTKVWPILAKMQEASAKHQSAKSDSKVAVPTNISRSDFTKKLRDAYLENHSPFEKLWIYNRTTLVFDKYDGSDAHGKTIAIDVVVLPDGVVATLFMRDGNLTDIQSFLNGYKQLKRLFPEVVGQRLRHPKISYAEASAFIDSVLAGFRCW